MTGRLGAPGRLRSIGVALGTAASVCLAVPVGYAAPSSAPAPDQDAVRVRIDAMTPRDLTGHATPDLSLRGTVTNTTASTLTAVRLRVQRGPLINTRSELHQVDASSVLPPVLHACSWQQVPLPHGLAPGASAPFTYHCDTAALAMTLIGIYPLAVPIQATTSAGVGYRQVGVARTYLPSFPDGAAARTQVSWLWPLVDRPHRQVDDARFLDDDLGVSVSPNGRLDRLLSIAEHAPKGVRLTLVVDPALVDALVQMTHGYQVRESGRWVTGRRGDAAGAWLDRLRRLADHYPVAALPYADPDVVALTRAGLSDLARITSADRNLLTERLGVAPITSLAWPPGGTVTSDALTTLVQHGTQAVVLDSSALPGQQQPAGLTPGAVTRLHTPRGTRSVALVDDPGLAAVVRASAAFPGGPRMAEQRYLAELAMITAESPSRGRDLVVAPPRRWDPDPVSAAAMLADTTTVDWMAPGSVAELASHQPEVDRGPVVYPAAARHAELPRGRVDELGRLRAQVVDFGSALVSRQATDQVVAPYTRALRRAASAAWRGRDGGKQFVAGLRDQVAELRSGIHVVKPSGSGVYVLASSHSPLFLTVANDLTQPVRIKVQITSQGAAGFSVADIGEQLIQARTRRTIQVPATVQRSGLFVVDALVTTPDGQPLGAGGKPVQLKVRSTAYGLIGVVITGAALLLLVLLLVRRLVTRLRHRPGSARSANRGPADDRATGEAAGTDQAGTAPADRIPDATPVYVAERGGV